jgi:hypothetical protein
MRVQGLCEVLHERGALSYKEKVCKRRVMKLSYGSRAK